VGGYDFDRNAPAPKISYQTGALADVLPSVWPDIALLFIFGILFFAGAYVSFLRYDLR
jgi:ABC-type transport system involved in multi-copper enzyme maturation permease subunit